MRGDVLNVHVDEAVTRYMMKIVFATRTPAEYGVGDIAEYLEYGASPRASINLYKAAKARAYLRGNDFVTPLDVADTVKGVLRHRIVLNYRAEAAGVTADDLIGMIMKTIKLP